MNREDFEKLDLDEQTLGNLMKMSPKERKKIIDEVEPGLWDKMMKEKPKEEKYQSFKPKLSKEEKVKKTKAYKYATSSLFGSIASIFFYTMPIGWIIASVSVIYAMIAIRLALKDKDQSTAVKAFWAIIIVILFTGTGLLKINGFLN
jgi:hypothetical protein